MATRKKTTSRKRPTGRRGTRRRTAAAGAPRALSATALAINAMDAAGDTGAKTIIYVHGIGNKPVASVLKCQWDRALFGFDLGEKSRLAYWVNREYYPNPEVAQCDSGDIVDTSGATVHPVSIAGAGADASDVIPLLTGSKTERATLEGIASALGSARTERVLRRAAADFSTASVEAKILPEFIRGAATKRITEAFLRDVHDFLFVDERRAEMERAVLERLDAGGGPFVVIGHSQGSMIAYKVLAGLKAAQADVRLFVTIGSPLGIAEVQDGLKKQLNVRQLSVPDCVKSWLNVADLLDFVAADKRISNDFAARNGVEIEDNLESNKESPHFHSGTGYLATRPVRRAVRHVVDTAKFQPVGPFVIARDLNRELEDTLRFERREVLIEIAHSSATGAQSLEEASAEVEKAIAKIRGSREPKPEVMQRFIAVDLTRDETERLASGHGLSAIAKQATRRIWRNAQKRALLTVSNHCVQAVAARNAYEAAGKGISWAVLDTGIFAGHPHFNNGVIAASHDCTGSGVATVANTKNTDGDGHGTHVAGIIAGKHTVLMADGTSVAVSGIAPMAKLHIYKVLDDDGSGKDSWIIKALDHIATTNARAVRPVIQGINLSLGGSFDQSSYACGHSPLCRELRRLWQQGVAIVIAAGNEGFAVLESADGPIDANMDITIGDPANLEEAIAVGSVHKENPHSYGVSYFSSRGPTADGRCKPDVVAPGERILSCRHRILKTSNALENHYVEMSGTSMAAPHVSGVIAAFLSLRTEFAGLPDKVKSILLASCTSLDRDVVQQGRGLVNLVKMLVQT